MHGDPLPFVDDAFVAQLEKHDVLEVVFDCEACRERVELTYVADVKVGRGGRRVPIVRHGNQYFPLTERDRARVVARPSTRSDRAPR